MLLKFSHKLFYYIYCKIIYSIIIISKFWKISFYAIVYCKTSLITNNFHFCIFYSR